MLGRRKKKTNKPDPPPPAMGHAAQADPQLYQAWAQMTESLGMKPHQRLLELIKADLEGHGMAPNPTGTGPAVLTKEEAEALKEANKKIDDAYTAAEIAEDFGKRLRDLTQAHIEQIKELTQSVNQIAARYTELESKLSNAPDFKAWTDKMNEVTKMGEQLMGQGEVMLERMKQLIEVQNQINQALAEMKKQIVDSVVGRIQETIDEMKGALAQLIEANNKLVEAIAGKKTQQQQQQTRATKEGRR